MSEWKNFPNEEQFERMLEKSASHMDQPPAEVVENVTPWRRAMERIITGTALNMLTLNFLYLQYILPTIGLVMLLLGFRALRRENRWFAAAYGISVYRCTFMVLSLILNATIYTVPEAVSEPLAAVNIAAQLLVYVCLWRGILAVQRKAGVGVSAPGAGGLIIWNGVLIALALVQYVGWLLLIGMVVVYIILLRTLAETSKTLDEAGYEIAIGPVRIPDEWVSRGITITIAAGILLGHFFTEEYRMDWQRRDEDTTVEATATKAELMELGYPDYALADLSEEDVLACQNAKNIVAMVEDSDRSYRNMTGSLRCTSVAVELEDSQWRFFHHFHWRKASDGMAPQFRGTDALQLWPVYQRREGWLAGDYVGGQVLYDDDDQTYTAPFALLREETYTANSFFGSEVRSDIFAGFSMPHGFKNQRGYIAYDAVYLNNGYIMNSWCNYIHQTAPFLYPAQTAMEFRKNGGWGWNEKFSIIQTALQASPGENGLFHT